MTEADLYLAAVLVASALSMGIGYLVGLGRGIQRERSRREAPVE